MFGEIMIIPPYKRVSGDIMPTIDVRGWTPAKRHPAIFEKFNSLKSGETLTLINDHNPEPLFYQMKATRSDFDAEAYSVKEEASDKWVAKLRKK
jgi:uncharacterized protein (DUF2249 family)